MSYEKTTWANGDIITAEKLNKMEDGIANGGSDVKIFTVNLEFNSNYKYTCDTDNSVIKEKLEAGYLVFAKAKVVVSGQTNSVGTYPVAFEEGSFYAMGRNGVYRVGGMQSNEWEWASYDS